MLTILCLLLSQCGQGELPVLFLFVKVTPLIEKEVRQSVWPVERLKVNYLNFCMGRIGTSAYRTLDLGKLHICEKRIKLFRHENQS